MKHIAFLFALLWLCNAQAQNFPLEASLPEKLAHLCAPLDKAQVPTGYLYNLAVPLAYRGSPTLKTLTFTPKTQHRRTWPQPSPLASRCGFSPLSFFGEGPGERPPHFLSLQNQFFMKKAMLLLLPLLAACWLVLTLPACHKDDGPYVVPPDTTPKPDTLPPFTTVGANTFGCKVNGKTWVVKAGDPVPPDPSFQLFASSITEKNGQGGYITVKEFDVGIKQTMSFGLPCKKGVLSTEVNGTPNTDDFSIWLLDYNLNKWYYPDYSKPVPGNRLEVLYLDTANNIISGTFRFTLYRGWNDKITNSMDSLVVTDGRFDIRYSN